MGSSKEQTLRESVIVALNALKNAQVNYRRAFGILTDVGAVNSHGVVALRREQSAYDQAVKQYTNAVNAWLTIEEFGARRAVKAGPDTAVPTTIRKVPRRRAEELGTTAIVEASYDAIIGKTLDGTIVSWNRGAEKIYGYKAEEMLGRSISEPMPPDRPDEFSAIMKALRRGQHIESYETTRVHKDGHLIDVSVTISPVRNNAGIVVGASVVAQDITKHKRAEVALRLSEERFRIALKNTPVVVCTQDRELRYTWISSSLLAWERQDFIGKTDADIVGAEEGSRLTAIKQNVLQTGDGSRTEVAITIEGVRHHFDLTVEPFRDSTGALLGLICSAIDTTPWKNLINKLQQALEEVHLLSGLLSICASCKKIQDEHHTWQPLESYIQTHSEAKFTHGLCTECIRRLYPEYVPR